jgi:hypothetical protein
MGVYAETYFTVVCKDNKVAKEVAKILKAKSKKSDEHGNSFGHNIKVYDNQVEGEESSGRYQNLEWRVEEMWEAIKGIKGVEEMNAPFLSEADGKYFEQE